MSLSTASSLSGSSRAPVRASRWAVLSRVLAATLGAYALASLVSLALARVLTGPKEEVVQLAVMPAYLVLIAAVLTAFAVRSAARAWLWIGGPALVLALVELYLRNLSAS